MRKKRIPGLTKYPRVNLGKKAGMLPGTPVYTGSNVFPTRISLIRYDSDSFNISEGIDIDKVIASIGDHTCNWIIVSGFEDNVVLEKLCNHFGISPLVQEDIFNVEHLPKIEDTENGVFITLKNLTESTGEVPFRAEQISIFLGKNILITFQETAGSLFDPIIDRLRNNKGKGRYRQEDYLAYMLVDHIVDNYYLLIDKLEDQSEELEQLLVRNPSDDLAFRFLDFKKKLSVLRRTIYPLQEEIRYLSREETEMISTVTILHLKDVQDHLFHIIQTLDNYREMISAMMDLLSANNSNRMNSIMKTLTLVSTIFIPLTFIAGIYGMNFRYMPELEWRYGYAAFLIFVAGTGMGMYFYMKRKNWF